MNVVNLTTGINIFSLLNLPAPSNVTEFDGWKVIFSSNSTSYSNISSVLQVGLFHLSFTSGFDIRKS
jgi:hypothetical protein